MGPIRSWPGPCSSQIRSASRLSHACMAWSADEVGRRQDRVEQAGRGEQCGVGDLRPGQLVGGVGVQPPVQMFELVVELLIEPVRRRHDDAAARAAIPGPGRSLRRSVSGGSGCAPAPPSRRHVASRRDTAARSCGTPRPPRPGAPGCTGRRGGRCAPRSAWPSRPGRSAAARRPAARSPARTRRSTSPGRRRGAAAPPPAGAPPRRRRRRRTGRYCSAATANSSGTAASRRAMASCSARRRGGSSPFRTTSRMRSWRNRTASRVPGSTTSTPSSSAGASGWSTTPAGCAGGRLQQARLGPPAQTRHRLDQRAGYRWHRLDPRRQQPGHFGLAQAAPAPPRRPTATRRRSRSARPRVAAR